MIMLKHYTITALFVWLAFQSIAQPGNCRTAADENQARYLEQTRQERQTYDALAAAARNGNNSITWVPIQIHDCVPSPGSLNGALDDYTLWQWLNDLNETFLPYNVQFYECGYIDRFANQALYAFDASEEPSLAAYDVPNVINIYYFNAVTDGSAVYCGYSYLPPSQDRIILSKSVSCSLDSDVLLHEMGHYLSLYHTHGKTGGQLTDELVDGSNCSTAGDDVCDTPADPNLYSVYNCTYSNTTLRDVNNQLYQPDPSNLMSYAPYNCRNRFTPGQMNRMVYSVHYDRNYLTGCAHPGGCETVIADFPYVEDFENGTGHWYPTESDLFELLPMQLNAGPTPTAGTGPAAAFSGSGYMYAESSNDLNAYDRYFVLNSPCFDLRRLNAPELRFALHAEGATPAYIFLQYSVDGGFTWKGDPTFLWVGQGNQGPAWQQTAVDLTDFSGAPYTQFRFVVNMAQGELADVALDSIAIADTQPDGCTLDLVSYVRDAVCYGDSSGQISVDLLGAFVPPVVFSWSNGATDPAVSGLAPGVYTLTVTDGNRCSVTGNFVISEPPVLQLSLSASDESGPGQSDGLVSATVSGGRPPYAFYWSNGATSAVLSSLNAGLYSVTVTDAAGCAKVASVLVSAQGVSCEGVYRNFPYAHGFESGLGWFEQETVFDNKNWTQRSGSTPTGNTGPSSAYEGARYRYLEASVSHNAPLPVAMLKIKKCLDFSRLTNPVFEFYYHMYGAQMGSLLVEISLDNENSWQTIWSRTGNQGNQWHKASIDLSAFKYAPFKIRVTGIGGPGGLSDIALDAYYFGESGGNSYRPASVGPVASTETAPELVLYPNPATEELNVGLPDGKAYRSLEIFDQNGRLHRTIDPQDMENRTLTIDLNGLAPGTYFLRLISDGGAEVRRFVKMK